MNEIKELMKIKNFVINPILMKNIYKYSLTLNEFLLLLYFINISCELNLDDIKKYIGLNDEQILDCFNSLVQKKVIELIVKKENGRVEEIISLDILYDSIILNNDDTKVITDKNNDIFMCFEQEFGRTLSPIEYETINNWINNNISTDMIKKALKEAVLNGVSNLRYIDKILYDWTKNGEVRKEREEKKVDLFDYNWLDE